MKLKLDENLDERLRGVIAGAGHDVSSVRAQDMRGETDERLFDICKKELRAIVTLDLDFSNVLRFPPQGGPGIIVLRGRNNLLTTMRELVDSLIMALESHSPQGRLWIIEPGRLRIHSSTDED